MPTLSKKQLTENISKKTQTPQNQVTKIIDELLLELKKALVKGEEVRFLGYFSFKTTMTKPRIAMNLQTKKKMKVPAKKVPKCKFSTNLKEAIKLDNGETIFVFSDSLEKVKNPKAISIMAIKTIKLKQLNLNPLSVAKYFYEKEGGPMLESVYQQMDYHFEKHGQMNCLFDQVKTVEDKEIKSYLTKTYRDYQTAKKRGQEIIFSFQSEDETWEQAREKVNGEITPHIFLEPKEIIALAK
ncbi:3636_t:CDS:2 [Funneliformis geosporum]|nr:3636_t:CDS:2 [Funneliformis geosporum]